MGPDSVTDIILNERDISSDEDIIVMARDISGYEIQENPDVYQRNLLKYPPPQTLEPVH